MKKLLLTSGLFCGLLFAVGTARATTPLDQGANLQGAYSNTSIWVSSTSATNATATITLSSVPFNSGGGSFPGRNCITDFHVEMSTASIFYILDGGTTDYYGYGANNVPWSGATASVLNKHLDHLGPVCGTGGNAMTIKIPNVTLTTAGTNVIEVEGYTFIGYQANGGTGQ